MRAPTKASLIQIISRQRAEITFLREVHARQRELIAELRSSQPLRPLSGAEVSDLEASDLEAPEATVPENERKVVLKHRTYHAAEISYTKQHLAPQD